MDIYTIHTEQELNQYIVDVAEESTYLEFKDGGAFKQKDDDCKNEIAKDISAFANADGGIIIYGMSEKDQKATGLSPVDGKIYTKEWLEQIINGRIKRQIPNFIIDPIRIGGNIDQSVYVVRIPRSIHAPHQTTKLEYWKRQNFQNRRMEEYEIRESYFRVSQTDLKILEPKISGQISSSSDGKISWYDARIDLTIQNIGNAIEKYFKLLIYIPKSGDAASLSTSSNPNFFSYFSYENDEFKIYAFPNTSPLFQNEQIILANVPLRFNLAGYKTLKEKGIQCLLLYSNGSMRYDVLPVNFLMHDENRGQSHQLQESCFMNRHL